MSDLFHSDIPADFLRAVFEVMLDVDRHTYQVLTKRPSRAARFVRQNGDLFGGRGLPRHIWIGTSTENQETAYRIRHLKEVPAVVRFLSCEPLIGPLSLCGVLSSGGIHWVIVGGESGVGADGWAVGGGSAGSVRGCEGAFLLQAVGRTHAEGGGKGVGGAGVE